MKKWLKIILTILTFAIISVLIFFILKWLNLTDLNKIKDFIVNTQQYGLIVYIVILTILLTLLCFIPLLNTSMIIMGIVLFGPLQTFFACLVANFLSTSLLFFIGDKCGERFAKKLIGEKTFEETQNLIDKKSKLLLPVLYLIPCVPDEALALVAGMTKIKYWYVLLVSLLYHALETGLFCFLGSDLIDWSGLSIFDWIIFINIIIVDIYVLTRIEKQIKK